MPLRVPKVYATLTEQDIKYTETQFSNGVSITYVRDLGPHAAVVDVQGRDITVHIGADTNAQEIVDAVNADHRAAHLVVAEVVGNPSGVQLTNVRTPLQDGTLGTTGTAEIGPMRYTCVVPGNSAGQANLRIRYVNGSIGVTLQPYDDGDPENPIPEHFVISFVDGVSTNSAVAAVLNADPTFSAVLKAATAGGVFPMRVSAASDITSAGLLSGLDATNPYKLIQNTGFGHSAIGTAYNGYLITYVPDGTAGAETVEFGATEMKIHMENGVSTCNQIVAAVNNAPENNFARATTTVTVTDYTQLSGVSFTVNGDPDPIMEGPEWTAATSNNATATSIATWLNYHNDINASAVGNVVTVTAEVAGAAGNATTLVSDAVSGLTIAHSPFQGGVDDFYAIAFSGSQVQRTVNEQRTSGGFSPSGRSFTMTNTDRTIKDTYFEYQFGFQPKTLHIKNNDVAGDNLLLVSYDGTTVAATLAAGESLDLTTGHIPHCVLLKYEEGAPAYEIEATAVGPNLVDPTGAEQD